MYKEIHSSDQVVIFRESDNAWIPCDLANTDYAEYLQWVAEGNTPEVIEQ